MTLINKTLGSVRVIWSG